MHMCVCVCVKHSCVFIPALPLFQCFYTHLPFNFTTLYNIGAVISLYFIEEEMRQGEIKNNLCKLIQQAKG